MAVILNTRRLAILSNIEITRLRSKTNEIKNHIIIIDADKNHQWVLNPLYE